MVLLRLCCVLGLEQESEIRRVRSILGFEECWTKISWLTILDIHILKGGVGNTRDFSSGAVLEPRIIREVRKRGERDP